MDPTSPGLWLVPTLGRVHDKLPAFLKAAKETGISTPGAVLVETRDYAANTEAYDALDLPEGWFIQVVPGGSTGDSTNQGYHLLCEDASWCGWLSDDLRPETPGWDVRLIEQLNGHNVVSSNDGYQAPKRLNGATVWSGDLIRAAGFLYPPGLRHFYLDDVWELIGQTCGVWHCDMNVMVRHEHPNAGRAPADGTTKKTNTFWEHDSKAFAKWKRYESKATYERVFALMEANGVELVHIDLTGISVMIATPCGSGRYEGRFMRSLMETEKALGDLGADVHFAEMPGCSDVALARNRLMAGFLNSDDTHILMIDDDMSWTPLDVIRLLMAKRDFVAVAGPRKVFPESYAVSVDDDRGNPMPIAIDPQTGFLEVSAVGAAFVCLTKACAVRMAQHYADLIYVTVDGQEEVGLFLPMIANRRWRSEDFAFGDRWRAMGGKIYVAAEIALGHVGSFMWQGSWANALRNKMMQEQAA